MPVPNLFVDDLTQCAPNDLQQAIVNLAQSGVEEKFRLDFKETWQPDKQCPDIVAFANTYGGLLILGVTDDRQNLPGIPGLSKSDLKTQIASVIATRINPVPVFEVHTCPSPSSPGSVLVVIRISPQPKIHMYLKGDRPIFIRNEDQTIAARATDLQALLDRVRSSQERDRTVSANVEIARDFFATKATDPNATRAIQQNPNNRTRSETFFRMTAIPEQTLAVGLDSVMDNRFVDAIYATFPTLGRRRGEDDSSRIIEREDRASSWYRYNFLDVERDHEAVWAFDKTGIIQFTCECSERIGSGPADLWSLVDLFVNLDGVLRLAQSMWTTMGHFGAGQFFVKLSIPGLVPMVTANYYPSLFYGTVNFGIPVPIARKLVGNYEVSHASAEAILNYEARTSERTKSLTSLGNQLLRDLRFSVDVRALNQALDKLPHPGN